ncbi:ATP-dependent zinc metalloprotease FtsH [Candidatus Babeliales bacterium]|nr:ATP-dependent zinc metalloprotease FtsH [Candidatus Babeliales bacterium]
MSKNKKQGPFKSMPPRLPGKGPNALWLLIALLSLGMLYLFWYNSMNRDLETVSYSKILTHIEQNDIKTLKIQDQYVQGEYQDGKRFIGYVAPTAHFWDLLNKHNVNVEVFPRDRNTWGYYFFALLPLIFLLMFFFYFRQSQGGGGGGGGKIFSVGKSKARFFSPNTITTTFKDVAGIEEAKEDLHDIVSFLKNPERFEKLGAKIPRGVLLSGAPGNGKTLLAKAVAGEASCPFFSISGSDFVEVFVGVGASRVRDLFTQARQHAPCIVFIDEIDAVGRQRGIGLGGGNDEREQTLNQLLAEMDGFSTEHGQVIVVAATNRPDVLDKALLRPGRFDRIVEVPYPDLKSRKEILEVHAKKIKLDPSVSLEKIARGTPGFSGADLENLINEAALLASKTNETTVQTANFEKARDKILLGAERKTLIFTDKEKKMTAYHEAGHTLLNLLQPVETDPFHKVTIIPRGRALGVSWSLPERDKYSQTSSEMLARIVVCFGGLLAEKMIFNDQTSGVSNDLEQASKIARSMVRRFGMSELGPIDYNLSQEHPYLGRDMQNIKEFSEKTAERIDREVEKIMQQCYDKGSQLLTDNKDKLELLAETLLEKETLLAQEVYELLGIQPRETHTF